MSFRGAGFLLASIVGLGVAAPGAATAEDDVDVPIDASLVLKFNERGEFSALRETWSFGYDYSGSSRPFIDADGDGSVDPSEAARAFGDFLGWMARFDYFTRISEDDAPLPHAAAEDVGVGYVAGRLVVAFTLPLARSRNSPFSGSRCRTPAPSTTSTTPSPT